MYAFVKSLSVTLSGMRNDRIGEGEGGKEGVIVNTITPATHRATNGG